MIKKFAFSFFVTALLVNQVSAACYSDTGKHTCFEYSGVKSESTSSAPIWIFEDWAGFVANPNTASSGLWIQATLDADDDDFEYWNQFCVNKNSMGECIDIFKFAPEFLDGYSSSQKNVGQGVQGRAAYYPCDDIPNNEWVWTGKVKVESISKNGVPVRSFYSFSPLTFKTGRKWGAGGCSAGESASWLNFSATIPAVWDSSIQRVVVPYSNTWHNTNGWPEGWKTEVTLTSFASQTMTVTVEDHLNDGLHGNSTNNCAKDNEGVVTKEVTLLPSQTKYVNVIDDHVNNSSARISHDTVLFVRLTPVIGGLGVTVNLSPRSSGNSPCSGEGEP